MPIVYVQSDLSLCQSYVFLSLKIVKKFNKIFSKGFVYLYKNVSYFLLDEIRLRNVRKETKQYKISLILIVNRP